MMNTTERTQEVLEYQTETVQEASEYQSESTQEASEYQTGNAAETAPEYATKVRPHWTTTAFKIVGVTLFTLAVATAAVGFFGTGGSFTLPQLSW